MAVISAGGFKMVEDPKIDAVVSLLIGCLSKGQPVSMICFDGRSQIGETVFVSLSPVSSDVTGCSIIIIARLPMYLPR
jgi:hypothetical protein